MAELAAIAAAAAAAAPSAATIGAGSALVGAGAGAYGALKAGEKPKMQPIPKAADPVKMPDEEDPKVIAERNRKIRERAAAGGRESTNLTGGGDYVNSSLGD